MGLEMIVALQRSEGIFLTIFFMIPTLIFEPGVIIAVGFIFIICTKQKAKTINTIIWVLINAFGSCLLKAYYADPRPFWSVEEI